MCTDSAAKNETTHSGPPREASHGAVHPGDLAGADRESRSTSVPRIPHDHKQFENEVVPHTAFLYGGAQALAKQRADAEELVQDTMLKAYMSLGTFRKGSNMKAWLYRIMLNTWVDNYRHTQRRPAEQLSGDTSDFDITTGTTLLRNCSQSAEVEMLLNVPGDALSALSALPTELQVTAYYADVEGYRNTEIAEMLEIPVGTVASRLHRARNRLREMLHGGCAA